MDGPVPLFRLEAAVREDEECPWGEFLGSEADARTFRAPILSKVEYLAGIDPADYRRRLVDTVSGQIKELRFGPKMGLRVLFSTEKERGVIVLYGGERKSKGNISPELIEEALELREAWVAGRVGVAVDIDHLRKLIRQKRLGWPE